MERSKEKHQIPALSRRILLTQEAENDLKDAINWYENNLSGLGSSFLLSIDAAMESISRNPEAFPVIYKNIRRTLIRKFPCGIHYIIEKGQIIVLAIFMLAGIQKKGRREMPDNK